MYSLKLCMDFILEEEMIDLLTYCLQNPSSESCESKKERFKEIGKELYESGGVTHWRISFLLLTIEYKAKLIWTQNHSAHYGME